MMEGWIKYYNDLKGFGFIESNGEDFFFHIKSVITPGVKTLFRGQPVNFYPGLGPKGKIGEKVDLLP